MISSIFYNGDGSTRIFPVTFKINGEDYVRVYVDNVEVIDRTKYDIINNSIVFAPGDIPAVGTDNIKIYVATSSSELGDLGAPLTDITNVANNLSEIIDVSGSLAAIEGVNNNELNINAVEANAANINIVAAQNTNITNIATQIVPNIAEILLADTNATTATTKASEASASATSAASNAAIATNRAIIATDEAIIATTKASEASASASSAATSASTATTKANEASASAATALSEANRAGGYADVILANITNINVVASDLLEPVSEIDVVANNITNVNNVGNSISNVNSVASGLSNINTVVSNIANINTAATQSPNITVVANNIASVGTVVSNITSIQAAAANATTATTQAGIATTKANEASVSAATATTQANRATAVVIPTTATYSYTQQDWRQSIMSKAAFNALAAERRANRAGSGFDEWGNHYTAVGGAVNDGMWTWNAQPNILLMGREDTNGTGTSRTNYPLANINGTVHKLYGVNSTTSTTMRDVEIILPPAPTVLPYDATLTTEQIAVGVIKHADSSNSGLIVNGKFTTDTSGWSATNSTLSTVDGKLRVTGTSINGWAQQAITTVVGKKYILEATSIVGTSGQLIQVVASPSTQIASSNVIGYNYIEFTATTTTTLIRCYAYGASGTYTDYDNVAVFPADAISRSDLVFLESWHEDVSEKDFVYPLGNVQYLGGVTDGMSAIAAGAFSGSSTYSLFGNWQASGALVGKGYVWSSMSDAQKKAFVSNPENNCYLDGDKVIQVRYRMRVVAGWGDSWGGVDPMNPAGFTKLAYDSSNGNIRVLVQGKQISRSPEIVYDSTGAYNSSTYFGYAMTDATKLEKSVISYGTFSVTNITNSSSTSYGYESKCYALPIALVHRRNKGGYDATYNPNGTRTMTMTPTCIADCFNPANYNSSTGYIGTSTSRPDGLFYDQVSNQDFKPTNKGADLRTTTKKRTAQSLIEEFAPKVIAGTLLYNNNDTTALTTYKDFMEVRDTSGNRYTMKNKIGNVVTINDTVANKKGFSIVTQNGKQYLQVADDAASDAAVQMNLSVTKYDLGVFDA